MVHELFEINIKLDLMTLRVERVVEVGVYG